MSSVVSSFAGCSLFNEVWGMSSDFVRPVLFYHWGMSSDFVRPVLFFFSSAYFRWLVSSIFVPRRQACFLWTMRVQLRTSSLQFLGCLRAFYEAVSRGSWLLAILGWCHVYCYKSSFLKPLHYSKCAVITVPTHYNFQSTKTDFAYTSFSLLR